MSEKNKALRKVRLTDAVVRTAQPDRDRRDYFFWDADTPGFGLRVHQSAKSNVLHYRLRNSADAGKRVRFKIGDSQAFPNVKAARRVAQEMLLQIAAGKNPLEDKKTAQRKALASVENLLDRYEKHLNRRDYVAAKAVMRILRRRLEPFFGREISTVSGWEIVEVIDRLESAGLPGGSIFHSRCTNFLNWCVFDARVLEADPLAGYRRKRKTRIERIAKENKGKALSDDELLAVWVTADPETSFGRLVRFLILTGCRHGEGAMLRREMVDIGQRRIDLLPHSQSSLGATPCTPEIN